MPGLSGWAETMLGHLAQQEQCWGHWWEGQYKGMFGSAGRTPGVPGLAGKVLGLLIVGRIAGLASQPGRVAVCWRGSRGSEEELVVAGLAVHLVAALTEGAFLQLAQAVGADEVLGVVLAPRGCDAVASHGAAAAVADAALPLVEVQLAVGLTLQLEEGATGKAA